jgi:hypothetical protein
MPINLSFKDEMIVGLVTIKGKLGAYGDAGKATSWSKTRQSAKDQLARQNLRVYKQSHIFELETALRLLAKSNRLPNEDLQQVLDECRDWLSTKSGNSVHLQFRRNKELAKGTFAIPAAAALKTINLYDNKGGGVALWRWDMPMSYRG